MSARVTEARELVDEAAIETSADGDRESNPRLYRTEADALAAAQVLATLEVAEQLRLANRIAYADVNCAWTPSTQVEIEKGIGA